MYSRVFDFESLCSDISSQKNFSFSEFHFMIRFFMQCVKQ